MKKKIIILASIIFIGIIFYNTNYKRVTINPKDIKELKLQQQSFYKVLTNPEDIERVVSVLNSISYNPLKKINYKGLDIVISIYREDSTDIIELYNNELILNNNHYKIKKDTLEEIKKIYEELDIEEQDALEN